MTEHFKGNNWKVHPDWTYCEYYFDSDKWFGTPEERVLHFMTQAQHPGWKWRSMRPRSPSSHQTKPTNKPDKDSYYCESMRLLRLRQTVADGPFVKRTCVFRRQGTVAVADTRRFGYGRVR